MGPGNSCDYTFRSSFAGDVPDIGDVYSAATGQKRDGAELVYPATAEWNEDLQTTVKAVKAEPKSSRIRLISASHYAIVAAVASVAASILAARGASYATVMSMVLIVAAGLAGEWFSRRGGPASKTPKKIEALKLLTIRDVDKLVLSCGSVKCECSFLKVFYPGHFLKLNCTYCM